MERIAFGVGIIFPNARQATVYPLVSRVFIGLPCPMNSTGILLISLIPSQREENPIFRTMAASYFRAAQIVMVLAPFDISAAHLTYLAELPSLPYCFSSRKEP